MIIDIKPFDAIFKILFLMVYPKPYDPCTACYLPEYFVYILQSDDRQMWSFDVTLHKECRPKVLQIGHNHRPKMVWGKGT